MTQEHAPSPAAPAEQRLIAGRYAVLREIGRGGMGIVWLAEDRMIGRRVAVKELHLPDGVPPQERGVFEERVLREARTAGRLNDPAVVIVYDVVQEHGNTYIVMELIEAPTLADVVQRGPLPQAAVVELAAPLLSALESAHAAGVVHRDVKPSNVMLLPNGRVKLTDFGIAQSLDDPRLTTSGVLIGSPNYLAPERIHGADANAASDLWALGAVLFYAVEGYSPFERSSTAATMHAITTEVPYLTRCQGPLASVIMGLLIASPAARLTAAQVRGLLAQIPGPHTGPQTVLLGQAYQNTMVATAPRPPARRRALRWLALAVVLVVAAAAFAGGWFAHLGFASGTEAADGGSLEYGEGGAIPEFQVGNGECGTAELRAGVSYGSASPCDKPHTIQVFGAGVPLDDSSDLTMDHPGRDRLAAYGRAWCGMVFASKWVPSTDKATKLTYVALTPTEKAWKQNKNQNERPVLCVLKSRDGSQLRTSMIQGS